MKFDSRMESTEGLAKTKRHLQQTSVPAAAARTAEEESPGTPREGWPSDCVRCNKENQSTLAAVLLDKLLRASRTPAPAMMKMTP